MKLVNLMKQRFKIYLNMHDADGYCERVTGIGGIFFKTGDQQKIKDWYNKHLGLVLDEYGSVFETRSTDAPEQKCYAVWSPFKNDTDYFTPSTKEFMVNYRVQDLEWLVEQLKKEGVEIVDKIETYDYGKFVHIMDPDGNKIELWEPVDNEFTKMYDGKTTH